MERLEELTNSQRQILVRMGVQLYYSRKPRGSAPAEVSKARSESEKPPPTIVVESQPGPSPMTIPAPPTRDAPTEEAPTFTEIQFVWLRGSAGILLIEQLHDDFKPFVFDLIAFLDWRAGAEPKSIRNGRFQWPKLDGGGGSPAGALRAFKEKYVGGSNQWLVTTPALATRLETYLLVDHGGAVHKIAEPSGALTADAKRKLWRTLIG